MGTGNCASCSHPLVLSNLHANGRQITLRFLKIILRSRCLQLSSAHLSFLVELGLQTIIASKNLEALTHHGKPTCLSESNARRSDFSRAALSAVRACVRARNQLEDSFSTIVHMHLHMPHAHALHIIGRITPGPMPQPGRPLLCQSENRADGAPGPSELIAAFERIKTFRTSQPATFMRSLA